MPPSKKQILQRYTQSVMQAHFAFRQFIQSNLRELKTDLSYEMLQVLEVLWRQDGLRQQALADATFKDKASMTLLINNLEKRGLVKRKEDAADGRNKLILLTKAGSRLQTQILPVLDELYQLAGKNITMATLTQAMETLESVQTNISAQ